MLCQPFWSLCLPVRVHGGRRECLPAEVGADHPGGSLLPPRGPGCSCGGVARAGKKWGLDSGMQQDSVSDETSGSPIFHHRSSQHTAGAFNSLFLSYSSKSSKWESFRQIRFQSGRCQTSAARPYWLRWNKKRRNPWPLFDWVSALKIQREEFTARRYRGVCVCVCVGWDAWFHGYRLHQSLRSDIREDAAGWGRRTAADHLSRSLRGQSAETPEAKANSGD